MDMVSNRKLRLLWPILILAVAFTIITFISGCGPDRSGTATVNQPPELYIVNTPPDGTTFPRNPEINWYATDIDGYIASYRYMVIREAQLYIVGHSYSDTLIKVSVEEFVDSLQSGYQWPSELKVPGWNGVGINSDTMDIPPTWTELKVDLNNTQAGATINLFADPHFPEDSSVSQYLFVQAEDNQGAKSDIVYRRYSRINHYPNTNHRADRVYINAKDEFDPKPGITLNWSGSDDQDWGRMKPPLQFEWRLYGPYNADDTVFVDVVKEDCVYDPDADSFVNCINVIVVEPDLLPPAIGNVPQPLLSSENESGGTWVNDTTVTLYDLFSGIPAITKTSQYKFVFWVRARDDGYLADPSPAFSVFYAIEALYEKDVMVLDDTHYKISSGRWAPWDPNGVANPDLGDLTLTKRIMKNYIDSALGRIYGAGNYTPLDTIHPNMTSDPQNYRTDYFIVDNYTSEITLNFPTMVDLLSHKIYLCLNEDIGKGPDDVLSENLLPHSFLGMAFGGTGFMMARNLANRIFSVPPTQGNILGDGLATFYGMLTADYEGWLYGSINRIVSGFCRNKCTWNEQFIGAQSEVPTLVPDLDVDLNLLQNRYLPVYEDSYFNPHVLPACPGNPSFYSDSVHQYTAMPEVGVCSKSPYANHVYLYKSKYGDESPYHGKVLATAMANSVFRSVGCMFTPLALDSTECLDFITGAFNFLLGNFEDARAAKKSSVSLASAYDISVEEARQRANDMLHEVLKEAEANPKLMKSLGLDMTPYVVRKK